jgi:tetratricopeptide (TPR) repeat protein
MRFHPRNAWLITAGLVIGLATVWRVVSGRASSRPEDLAARVKAAVKEGRWSQAERLFDRLADQRPLDSDDIFLRAEMELRRGRYDDAVRLLSRIGDSDPHAAQARLAAGQFEKSQNRARRMEVLYRAALRLNPRLIPAHRELIYLYSMQARRGDLNGQYRALSKLQPLDFDDVFFWTFSLEDIWINDTIRPILERFITADPADHESRLALAAVLFRSGDVDRAEETLGPIPDSDGAGAVLRARIALRRGEIDRLRKILQRGPADQAELAVLRAQLAGRSGDPSEAAREFQLALQLDPTNVEAHQGLALALRLQGRGDEAAGHEKTVEHRRSLRDLLEKAKNAGRGLNQDLFRQLAETCEAIGRSAEARAWYRLALISDPLDPALQQSLYRLRDRDSRDESKYR